MGVYGALLTGVTGLAGQSTKMGAISDNIANVNTVGYKKADIPFQSLVTDPFGRSTTYSPGGVLAKPRQLISQQGVISGTASATDMAISGRGFFVVSEETDAGLDNSRFYTRAGSFRTAIDPDDPQKSLLQNTGGFYLTGIPVEDRNNLPQPNTLVGLETVNVNRINQTARATENVKTQANLAGEAEQQAGALTIFNANGTQKAFTAANNTAPGSVNVTMTTTFSVRLNDATTRNVSMNELFGLNVGDTISGATVAIGANQGVKLDADLALTVAPVGAVNVSRDLLFNNGFTNGESVEELAAALNNVQVGVGANVVTFNASIVGGQLEVFGLVDDVASTATTITNALGDIESGAQVFANFADLANPANPASVRDATVQGADEFFVPASGFAVTVNGASVTVSLAALRGTGLYDPNGANNTAADFVAALTDPAVNPVTVDVAGTPTDFDFTGTQVTAAGLDIVVDTAPPTAGGSTINTASLNNQFVLGTSNNGGTDNFADAAAAITAAAPITTVSLDRFVDRFNDYSIDLDGDTNVDVDFSSSIDANGFLSFSANQDGKSLSLNLSNADIDDAVANDADFATANGVIAGSNGDFATLFQSDLTQTQLIYDALGAPHNVTLEYAKRPDESNLWEVNLSDDNVTDFLGTYDPTLGDGNGARFAVRDTGGNVIETQRLFLKFNGDGSLAEVRTTLDGETGTAFGQRGAGATSGVVANRETDVGVDPKLISIVIGPATVAAAGESVATPIRPIPNTAQVFGGENGAPTTAEAVVYEWNVGRPTDLPGSAAGTGLDGLTQFDSGEETPEIETNFYSQDGARLGNISGVSVDQNGTLFALFDNGMVEPIYVLPVATFNNPDGLINYTGNIFAESGESGQVQVKRAGDQGAGDIIGSAVENSNVDLGDEFTDMIITQQSFTANTRVITTSDRMLEELVRILR